MMFHSTKLFNLQMLSSRDMTPSLVVGTSRISAGICTYIITNLHITTALFDVFATTSPPSCIYRQHFQMFSTLFQCRSAHTDIHNIHRSTNIRISGHAYFGAYVSKHTYLEAYVSRDIRISGHAYLGADVSRDIRLQTYVSRDIRISRHAYLGADVSADTRISGHTYLGAYVSPNIRISGHP